MEPKVSIGEAHENVELRGWGRATASVSTVYAPGDKDELALGAATQHPRGHLARGLGRSYGDAAQNSGGVVLDTTAVARIEVDAEAGVVTADAGASIERLLEILVPQGFFVPVTPGTRYVTVGGAIAADIHGKDHHGHGTWCHHVERMTLALPDGSVRSIGPEDDPDLFWATAGGMGLTGVILDATFRCPRIETNRLLVDTHRTNDLDETMATMAEGDDRHRYSVAWIDLMSKGAGLGRSVLTQGSFAASDELGAKAAATASSYVPRTLVAAPPWVPRGLLNRATVRAFNEGWFRKAPVERHDELQTISQFFHPLDLVGSWNRLYGPGGFLQWQFVVPFGAEDVLRRIVEQLANSGFPSFLAVLKRFGEANPGMLSFPIAGWTLALDIPAGTQGLGVALDRLDQDVAEAGGRVYLAKDSRLRPELLPIMYPRLDEWRAVRERCDPDRQIRSDLARRLHM